MATRWLGGVLWFALFPLAAPACTGTIGGDNSPCGVTASRRCDEQEGCSVDADCTVGSCITGTCNAIATECASDEKAAAGNGLKLCDGNKCGSDAQCASATCKDGTCAPVANKTCGVGLPNACANGEICQSAADCSSDYCDKTCAAPAANVHDNGKRDGGETGTDCGGSVKADKPCAGGEKCIANDDCQGVCKGGVCDPPSSTDGKKNQDETDVDCGGATAPKCLLGKACAKNEDCQLLACTASICVKPTETDGTQNGGESDVDCGGSGVTEGDFSYTAPRCKDASKCAVDGDCMTGACAPNGACSIKSCDTGEVAGITSCGAKETGEAGAVHDSCCRSLPLPTRTTRRMDKYEITSGRFRSFLTSVGPNVRDWVSGFVAANPTSQLATLVGFSASVLQIYPSQQTGPHGLTAHMGLDIDNYNGVRGCYNGDGNYSANTYWQDAGVLTEFGLPARSLPREISDEKPLNCAMPIMFAAFCAWDGGEIATIADYYDVWAPAATVADRVNSFPWAATNLCPGPGGDGPQGAKPCPHYNWCNGTYMNGGFKCQNTAAYAVGGQAGVFYEWPLNTDKSKDNEVLIGAPGRFVDDASTVKGNGESWMDLYANLAEYTGDFKADTGDFCDLSGEPLAGATTCTRSDPGTTPPSTKGPGTKYTGIPQTRLIGQTWEGHQYYNGQAGDSIQATFQYGKFGARCVRPVQ